MHIQKSRRAAEIVVPFLHNSWDSWNEFYNTIIKNARIIKESGVAATLRVANGGTIPAPDYLNTNPLSEQEHSNKVRYHGK